MEGAQNHQTSLSVMIEQLVTMSKPKVNDERQRKYCHFINTFLSHFGSERCVMVGSTEESTRLRTRRDIGDFDFLIISEIVIPIECLNYIDELPCFVHINGLPLRDRFPNVELVDDIYLPSSLLTECRPEAFKLIRHIYNILSYGTITLEHNVTHVHCDREIKTGRSLITYNETECPDLEVSTRDTDIDHMEIRKQFQNYIETQPQCSFGKLLDLFRGLKVIMKDTPVFQIYGPIIDALAGNISDSSRKKSLDQKTNIELLVKDGGKKSSDRSKYLHQERHCIPESKTLKHDNNEQVFNEQNASENDNRMKPEEETNGIQETLLQYDNRSQKDFVPAFRLSGKPKYLDDWKKRERNWPNKDIVEDIYNSEFFVVAKPAILNPFKSKDFTIGYSIAEIKMARAMSAVQRNTILILKAFQKSLLRQYSKDVTSFHWKTVVYWVSETWNPNLFEFDTVEMVTMFLKNVLEHMIDCLCKQELQHYFIPSNLFAGLDIEQAFQVVSVIVEIHEDPVKALEHFFLEEKIDAPKFEVLPTTYVKKMTDKSLDPSQQSKTKQLSSILDAFTSLEKCRENVNIAITDLVISCLPFLKEEMERDETLENIDNQASLDDVFKSFSAYFTVSTSDQHAYKKSKDELIHDILSLHPHKKHKK